MMRNLQDEARYLAQARLDTSTTKKQQDPKGDFIVLNKILSPESCQEDQEVQQIQFGAGENQQSEEEEEIDESQYVQEADYSSINYGFDAEAMDEQSLTLRNKCAKERAPPSEEEEEEPPFMH